MHTSFNKSSQWNVASKERTEEGTFKVVKRLPNPISKLYIEIKYYTNIHIYKYTYVLRLAFRAVEYVPKLFLSRNHASLEKKNIDQTSIIDHYVIACRTINE